MYEIKVLFSKDFDEVAGSDPRYEYVDETNLGFADRLRGKAYIRQSHLHELNKYLVDHELEELESDHSTHEDPNGIRHKKLSQFIKNFYDPRTLFDPGLQKQTAAKNQANDAEQAQRRQQNIFQEAFAPQSQSSPQLSFSAPSPIEPNQNLRSGALPVEPAQSFRPTPSPIEPNLSIPQGSPPVEPPQLGSARVANLFSGFNAEGPSAPSGGSVGGVSSILNNQGFQSNPFSNIGDINPDVASRLKGFYAGRRLVF